MQPATQVFLGFRHTFLPHEHRFCGTGTRDKPLRMFAWEARVNDPYMQPHPLLCQGEGCSYTQVRVMHLPMLCRRAGGRGRQGMGWGFDCLCWPWGRKDLEIMEANENKQKLGGFHCFVFKFRLFQLIFDQLNLLRYLGIKVNGSKEQPSRFFASTIY